MRVLVFLFSALPPSFFVTLTTEAEWRGVSAGKGRDAIPATQGTHRLPLMKPTKLLPAWIKIWGQNGPKGALFSDQNTPKTEMVHIQATQGTHHRPSLMKTTEVGPAWIQMP